MPEDTSPYYITTPIYYVNDSPHIGHAYTTLACDVMARYQRLHGRAVKFLTGTDEHGQKVEKSAKAVGKDPQSFTDEVSQRFRDLADFMQFSHDDFIRTTEGRHKKGAQAFWKRLEEKGYIYLDKYAGWYSVRDEAYYQESELIEGKAPTGADVEWVEEESYFFKLSAFEDKLLQFYDANPQFVFPTTRFNEVKSFVKDGLKDLSISRTTFNWGVPVPGNDKHVMYVWLDALTNYITALGYPDEETDDYQKFWVQQDGDKERKSSIETKDYEFKYGKAVHVVGKDILRFHAVYWPAFLMAADMPLPRKIVAHGWWTNEGEKISKSLGNVIDPIALVNEFGLDQTRYFMMRHVHFGSDGNYSRGAFINRINSDLANTIGNLAQRTLSMIQKNCDGKIPEDARLDSDKKILTYDAESKLSHLHDANYLDGDMGWKYSDTLSDLVGFARNANEYIDAKEPWRLKKEDPKAMADVLYTLVEEIRHIAILLQPFVPDSASKILDQLAVSKDERSFAHLLDRNCIIKPGTVLPKPAPVFPRLQEDESKGAA